MTTEDDFQKMLDANPTDHQTRMLFSDWLRDRDDPRADGYLALGVLGKNPAVYDAQGNSETTARINRIPFVPHSYRWWRHFPHISEEEIEDALQPDWLALTAPYDYHISVHSSRREAEDAAAHAFAQLPEERKKEILSQNKIGYSKKFISSLDSLLKPIRYNREQFERNIDADPHDWQNRLVYADWLDENEQPKEAAFQRSMAEWHRDKAPHVLERTPSGHMPNASMRIIDEAPYKVANNYDFPNGVNQRLFEWMHPDHNGLFDGHVAVFDEPVVTSIDTSWHHHNLPRSTQPDGTMYHGYLGRFAWHTYRQMENAFRKAFMKQYG